VFLQISNLQVQAHVIRRCFEAVSIKEDGKQRLKMTQHKQSTRNRKSTKCSVREALETRPARGHHRLTMGTHGRASWVAWPCALASSDFAVFLRSLSFSYTFCFLFLLFLPLKEHVSRHLRGDSSIPFHSPFSIFFSF